MRRILQVASTLAAFAMFAVPLSANGPTPQKVDETIAIAAPPDAVWNLVKDFAAISTWHPDVAKSEGRGGNEAGGERDVVLKSGAQLTDSLDEYVANDMTYSYRLAKENVDAIPVSFYSATLQVKPGAYLRIGQGRDASDPGCFLHNSRYDFNDEILPLGSALFASLVEQAMPLADAP